MPIKGSRRLGTDLDQDELAKVLTELISKGDLRMKPDELYASLDDPSVLTYALLLYAQTLAADRRPEILAAAYRTAQRIRGKVSKGMALSTVFLALRREAIEMARVGDVDRNLGLIEDIEETSLRDALNFAFVNASDTLLALILGGTAKRATIDVETRILSDVVRLPESGRAEALTAIAPHLSSSDVRRELLTVAMDLEARLRIPVLAAVAPYLPVRERRHAFESALTSTSELAGEEQQGSALANLGAMVPVYLMEDTVERIRRLPEAMRENVFAAIGPRLNARLGASQIAHLHSDPVLRLRSSAALRGIDRLRFFTESRLPDEDAFSSNLFARVGRSPAWDAYESIGPSNRALERAVYQVDSRRTVPAAGEDGPTEPPPPIGPGQGGPAGDRGDRRAATVNTGFVLRDRPAKRAPKGPLVTSSRYYFWIDIRDPDPLTEEHTPASIEAKVGDLLDVVMFSQPNGLLLDPASPRGTFEVTTKGPFVVRKSAAVVGGAGAQPDYRLYFSVDTPAAPGTYYLRCNILVRQVLLQSRRIDVPVASAVDIKAKPRASHLTYVISHSLAPSRTSAIDEHLLSVQQGMDPDGTHWFCFHGPNDFEHQFTFSDSDIGQPLAGGRTAMGQVSWDVRDGGEKMDRHLGRITDEQLEGELTVLARAGYRMWSSMLDQLDDAKAKELASHVKQPGVIQFAPMQSAGQIWNLAMVYDYVLDTGQNELRFCKEGRKALADRGTPLGEQPCFRGCCPSRQVSSVVCPGGFWGFRHSIGVPVSLRAYRFQPNALSGTLAVTSPVTLAVAVSTDDQLTLREPHVARVNGLVSGRMRLAENRKRAMHAMRNYPANMVYFYCHGGVAEAGVPYIEVGKPGGDRILPDNLRAYGISWEGQKPRPLIFINGCHTTDLAPEKAINLVSSFVQRGAVGVMGTEIAVFEPLATAFAERFIERFLNQGQTIGDATRDIRLDLLQNLRNPLGLIYIPFALTTLHAETVAAHSD